MAAPFQRFQQGLERALAEGHQGSGGDQPGDLFVAPPESPELVRIDQRAQIEQPSTAEVACRQVGDQLEQTRKFEPRRGGIGQLECVGVSHGTKGAGKKEGVRGSASQRGECPLFCRCLRALSGA